MGQGRLICNIDKKEFLRPLDFGEGDSIAEFGRTGDGILQAQSVLMSDACGRGWCDISRTAYGTDPPEIGNCRNGERVTSEIQTQFDGEHKKLPPGTTTWCRTFVPACAGRWAGDRVVVAGCHSNDTQYLSEEEVKRYLHTVTLAHPLGHPQPDPCLFDYAVRFYQNISRTVINQLRLFELGSTANWVIQEQYEQFLSRALLDAFDPHDLVGKGHRKKRKYDLSWMTFRQLFNFIDRWKGTSTINHVKSWMRAQGLAKWQRETLKHIQMRGGRIRVDNPQGLERMLAELNVPKMFATNDWGYVPLLPSRHYLYAAMEVQMEEEGLEFLPRSEQVILDKVRSSLSIRQDQRVIDIDGS